MNDHERIVEYAERYFERSGNMHWPTVREAARSLGWTQERVQDAVEGHPDGKPYLTMHDHTVLGDWFIEVYCD